MNEKNELRNKYMLIQAPGEFENKQKEDRTSTEQLTEQEHVLLFAIEHEQFTLKHDGKSRIKIASYILG